MIAMMLIDSISYDRGAEYVGDHARNICSLMDLKFGKTYR